MSYKDKAKQREYQRQWVNRRRAKYLEGKKCAECGCIDNLQWHHKDPTKKISHRIWSWKESRIKAELLKCETLCQPCHHKLHHPKLPCGSWASYKRGCRCRLCKDANAKKTRDYRQRKHGPEAYW